ncbi:aldo/keto reductase [candidate division KSB1 bacterium]|nr:aldo/keto reductase [candidate division KSB1 bacterium]
MQITNKQQIPNIRKRKLGQSTLDLFYHYRIDPVISNEDVAGAVKVLVQEKVRQFGLSGAGARTIHRADVVHQVTVTAVQREYSLNLKKT